MMSSRQMNPDEIKKDFFENQQRAATLFSTAELDALEFADRGVFTIAVALSCMDRLRRGEQPSDVVLHGFPSQPEGLAKLTIQVLAEHPAIVEGNDGMIFRSGNRVLDNLVNQVLYAPGVAPIVAAYRNAAEYVQQASLNRSNQSEGVVFSIETLVKDQRRIDIATKRTEARFANFAFLLLLQTEQAQSVAPQPECTGVRPRREVALSSTQAVIEPSESLANDAYHEIAIAVKARMDDLSRQPATEGDKRRAVRDVAWQIAPLPLACRTEDDRLILEGGHADDQHLVNALLYFPAVQDAVRRLREGYAGIFHKYPEITPATKQIEFPNPDQNPFSMIGLDAVNLDQHRGSLS